jgi:hypothetical protein
VDQVGGEELGDLETDGWCMLSISVFVNEGKTIEIEGNWLTRALQSHIVKILRN